ncbi:FkbM family methyltransferase [Candidatus Omnitrophota bacterium]
MKLQCTVVDVGARYGLHPTWQDLRDVVNLHLFEIDTAEVKRLKRKYAACRNIKIYPNALYSSNCTLRYIVKKHRGLNSLLEDDRKLRNDKNFMIEETKVEALKQVSTTTIDSRFRKKAVHFLKIDTEGSELEVLKGATRKLNSTVLGVRAEAYFIGTYKHMPLFGDIDSYLRKYNFELLNFDYDGRGHAFSKFTLPDKFGQLIGAEAVWIKNLEVIFKRKKERLLQDVLLMAIFLMNNNASDIAINLMLRAVKEKKVNFKSIKKDPLFKRLKRQIAFLFKDLLSLPMTDKKEIYITYEKLFNEQFPKMNKFYETFSL